MVTNFLRFISFGSKLLSVDEMSSLHTLLQYLSFYKFFALLKFSTFNVNTLSIDNYKLKYEGNAYITYNVQHLSLGPGYLMRYGRDHQVLIQSACL